MVVPEPDSKDSHSGSNPGHIKMKPTFDLLEVSVRELPTTQDQNKCFVVSAPFHKKDVMYRPDFWPRGVGVKRFDFKRHADYDRSNSDRQPSAPFM